MNNFFDLEEVKELDALQNLNIEKVLAHYWVNIAKDEPVRVLDTLEVFFVGGKSIALCGRTDECLKVVKPNIEKDLKELVESFNGKIVLKSEDITNSNNWLNTGMLNHISLRKGDDGFYLNDAILLSFEKKDIVVYFDGDSIEIDEVFEEIDE
jgi:hypothetical protein